jgi:hypothetical protein
MPRDQPLSVVRANYVDLKAGASHITFSPFAVVPLWNSRGESDDGYFADTGLRTRWARGPGPALLARHAAAGQAHRDANLLPAQPVL